jgi:hypothetical protein
MRLVVLYDGNIEGDSRLYVRDTGDLQDVTETAATSPLWSTLFDGAPDSRELDTGSLATLQTFITWARTTYPGSSYTFLSVVDHGGGWAPDFGDPAQPGGRRRAQAGGWRGMSLDLTTPGGSSFSTRNTAEALAGTGRFDVLFFDACLMGMIESAYEVQPYADYFIAGQNLLWAALPYEHYLDPETLQGSTTPEELTRRIVERYNQGEPSSQPFTISALDMSKLPTVVSSTNTLALRLLDALNNDPFPDTVESALRTAYQQAQKFDYDSSLTLDQQTDGYVDLADFARILRASSDPAISGAIKDAATAVYTATIGTSEADGAVMATRTVSGTLIGAAEPWDFSNAHGLSIYMPLGEQDNRPTSIDPDDPNAPAEPERQLYYYTNCDFTDCGQLTFTQSGHAEDWARLLVALEGTTPARDLEERPFQTPFLLRSSATLSNTLYLPLVIR